MFSSLNALEYSALKISLLDTIFFHYGIDAARVFIQQSLAAPPNALDYYRHCITIEDAQPSPLLPSLQSLYEIAVQEYGNEQACEDVWLGYIQVSNIPHLHLNTQQIVNTHHSLRL